MDLSKNGRGWRDARVQNRGGRDPDVLDAEKGGERGDGGAPNPRSRFRRSRDGGAAGVVELPRSRGSVRGERGAYTRAYYQFPERAGSGAGAVRAGRVHLGAWTWRGAALQHLDVLRSLRCVGSRVPQNSPLRRQSAGPRVRREQDRCTR